MKTISMLVFTVCVFSSAIAQVKASNIPQREAVFIIGSSIGDHTEVVSNLNEIAGYLESQNFKVTKFYNESNDWEAIKKASTNASIFLYRGHGTELGIDGGFGGIVIGEFISGQRIAAELKFKNKPIILFSSVCGGAGSSAGDLKDIGITEANKRIVGSSLPFLLAGGVAYYASNYPGGIVSLLKQLFDNKTLEESFIALSSDWNHIERNQLLNEKRLNGCYKIGVLSAKGGGISTVTRTTNGVTTVKKIISPKGYEVAYLGDPTYKMNAQQLISKK